MEVEGYMPFLTFSLLTSGWCYIELEGISSQVKRTKSDAVGHRPDGTVGGEPDPLIYIG
jgi:hypothetical protein